MEYKSIRNIPNSIFAFPAIIARSTIKIGVEQGEENNPPKIPAKSAPINPRFLPLVIKLVEGMKLNIPHVCNAINSITTPKTMYHQVDVVPINLPAVVATIPSTTNVTAEPIANTSEYPKAFFVFFSPFLQHTR